MSITYLNYACTHWYVKVMIINFSIIYIPEADYNRSYI